MGNYTHMSPDLQEESMELAMELGMNVESLVECHKLLSVKAISECASPGAFARWVVDECYKAGNEDLALVAAVLTGFYLRAEMRKIIQEVQDGLEKQASENDSDGETHGGGEEGAGCTD